MSKQITQLNQNLLELNDKFRKRNVFVRGIVRGVGFAIGTTIIASLIFALLAMVLRPYISDEWLNTVLN